MDVWPRVHMLQCGAGLGERDPEPENGMWEKESGEKELGEVGEKKVGEKEPAVAPGMGKRECNRMQ